MNIKTLFQPNKELMNGPFLILAGGRLISQFGDKLYLLALPWLVLELTHSALSASITLGLEILPEVIFSPFIGVYVDRLSRKKLMIFSDWIRGFIVGGISLLAVFNQVEMIHIYLAAFLLSIFTLLFDSASQGFLAVVVPKDQLVDANANLIFINTVMRLIGPVFAGIFISSIGADGTIGINAVSFILSGLVLAFLPTDHNAASNGKKAKKIVAEIKEGFQYLFHHEVLFPIALFSTFMNVGIYLVTTLLIYESKETLGYGPEATSTIFWVSGITTSITTMMIKYIKKWVTKGQIVRFGSMGVLLAILLLIYDTSLITITTSYSLLLMVGTVVNVNMMAYRQEIIPNHLFGRVMTSTKVMSNSLAPLAMLLSGWLATKYSAALVFELAAGIIFINVLYAWFSRMKLIK